MSPLFTLIVSLLITSSAHAEIHTYKGRSAIDGSACVITIQEDNDRVSKVSFRGVGTSWDLMEIYSQGFKKNIDNVDDSYTPNNPLKKRNYWFTEGYQIKGKVRLEGPQIMSGTISFDIDCPNGMPTQICIKEKTYLLGIKFGQFELRCENLQRIDN